MTTEFETVLGIEVHAQLLTRSKMYCRCATAPGLPNTRVCPVCLGLPGALPVVNREAVTMAVRAGLGLHCQIREKSRFARKNYFYPDLPKGYQITQFDEPLCEWGYLDVPLEDGGTRRVGIRRIHMEEDAGKNLHGAVPGQDVSLVDLNRAGVGLIEIVSEPDMRSPAEAAEYLKQLRAALVFLGVNDGNLEEGSFRCDVNVSVRPRGSEAFGTRCEIKNVNSFRFVMKAIEVEVAKQIATITSGGKVRQFTKQYSAELNDTIDLREKGNADDYRYFPEPDLPPLVLPEGFVESVRATMPELPWQKRHRYATAMEIPAADAATLTEHPELARYFERTVSLAGGDPRRVANFLLNEVKRDVSYDGLSARFPFAEESLAELMKLVDSGTINLKIAKEVYARMVSERRGARELVDALGLTVVDDASVIEDACRDAIEKNPKQAQGYRAGKTALLGFFVGQVMKATAGRAAPEKVNATLARLLSS
jgi:aspartyl-tRNA(Asn)/glutamyl-tRNA(Gln) amidotransferase subunit B